MPAIVSPPSIGRLAMPRWAPETGTHHLASGVNWVRIVALSNRALAAK